MGSKNRGNSSSTNVVLAKPSPTAFFKEAFFIEEVGLSFAGSKKSFLRSIKLDQTDLVINCTGEAIPKNYIKGSLGGNWNDLLQWETVPTYREIVIDIPDFSFLPKSFNIGFWRQIIELSQKQGIKRITACCDFGKGRTGTVLAAFLIASLYPLENVSMERVVEIIREKYYEDAIESNSQKEYIKNLLLE